MIDFDADREPLDVVAEEFAERCRLGEPPAIDEYELRYPQWAEELRALLPGVARMEECKRWRLHTGGRPVAGSAALGRIGEYRLLREIGRGGMGIVYEAEQESLGRRVALKVLPHIAHVDPKKIERFHREAQAAARLHHTNIVPVFGIGDMDGLPYYVMQYIDGSGLDAVLAGLRQGNGAVLDPLGPPFEGNTVHYEANSQFPDATPDPAPPATSAAAMALPDWPARCRWVAAVGEQVAQALAYAHRQGVLHRDIKPANLLLDQNGMVWITDFGLAKLACQDDLTKTGDIVGTLQYLAPETLRGEADARGDIYSLGLTLYELLTLAPPFAESHPAKLLECVSRHEPVPPRKLNRAIPRDLETIVLKAIAREPIHRYQSAEALATDLRSFLDDRPITARRIHPAERLWRWCRRNRAVAGLTAAALAAFLCAGIVGWVGYVSTRAALAGEAKQTGEALAATARAEANVEMSLAAFESMFNYITRRRLLPAPQLAGFGRGGGGGGGFGTFPSESPDDATLLQKILDFYERFAAQNATNAHLQIEAAKAYRRVADLQQRLGRPLKAEAAFARATAILERLTDAAPAAPAYRLELAETYAQAQPTSNDPAALAEAEQRLQHALAMMAELPPFAPDAQRTLSLQARAEGRLGSILLLEKRRPEAERAYRRSLDIYRTLEPRPQSPPVDAVNGETIRLALADLMVQDGRLNWARLLLETGIERTQKLTADHANFRPLLFVLAEHYQALAEILTRQGESSLAAEAMHKAESLRQQRAPLGPGTPPAGQGRERRTDFGDRAGNLPSRGGLR